MQGLLRAVRCRSGKQSTLELTKSSRHAQIESLTSSPTKHCKGFNDAQSQTMTEKGLQNTTVADVLMTKGEEKVGSWLWCQSDDTVYDAVKQVSFFSSQKL